MSNQPAQPGRKAVLGVGSPHGDDCVGWSAVESLRGCVDSDVILREVSSPSQILDHLDGITQLIVIDGCRGGVAPGTVVRCRWPQQPGKVGMRFATSHDLSLVEILKLAETLGRLPRQVTIVLMEIGNAAPGNKMSESLLEAIPELVKSVVQEMETTN